LVANRDAAGRSVDVGFEIDEGERIGNCRAPPRGRLLVLGFVELGFEWTGEDCVDFEFGVGKAAIDLGNEHQKVGPGDDVSDGRVASHPLWDCDWCLEVVPLTRRDRDILECVKDGNVTVGNLRKLHVRDLLELFPQGNFDVTNCGLAGARINSALDVETLVVLDIVDVCLHGQQSVPALAAAVAANWLSGGLALQGYGYSSERLANMQLALEDLVVAVIIVLEENGRQIVVDVVVMVSSEAGGKGWGE
jgi:hypothetical protein